MPLSQIPAALHNKYAIDEREHACAILAGDFPNEFRDLLDCLAAFKLNKSYIVAKGGARSPVPFVIDSFLCGWEPTKTWPQPPVPLIGPKAGRGWSEKSFDIQITVDSQPIPIPTHEIDNFKNRVGLEVEWNNKDPFYDRDLNNFRLLRNLRVLSVGVIITRLSELQGLFVQLNKGDSYGASTTHWDKLIPRVDGGGAGGCPLLLIGMGLAAYDPNA